MLLLLVFLASAVDVELDVDVERVVLVNLLSVLSLAHGCYIIISQRPK